jgi:transcription termination factor Rho
MFDLLKNKNKKIDLNSCSGILEILQDGFGFLRSPESSYLANPNDIYISPNQIRKFNLKTGDKIKGKIRPPKDGEKYFALFRVDEVNNDFPNSRKNQIFFEDLTPLHPCEKFFLELNNNNDITSRIIDIITPLGKGQRALLVSPPKSGKTIMLQNIAKSLITNNKECFLMILLVDERPEEVTEMTRNVGGEVISSTFDEPPSRHVQIAEMVIERAKRLVEHKKDVIVLLDSITRLARAYNAISPTSGKILTGGVESNALQRPKRFFGSARNIEEGGSLTIIATALIETGSKMDDVIFEEFKGTGNSEIYLDRKISERKIYPAINIIKSSTRREELLVDNKKLKKIWNLRKILNQMDEVDAIEFLIKNLKNFKDNNLFIDLMNLEKDK